MDSPNQTEADFYGEHILKILEKMELLAEDILADKQKMIELDRRRQKNREALRALKKSGEENGADARTWCVYGNSFMRTRKQDAEGIISTEQAEIENELEVVRKRMKKTMQELSLLEGRKGIESFNLVPLNKEEVDALHKIIGAT